MMNDKERAIAKDLMIGRRIRAEAAQLSRASLADKFGTNLSALNDVLSNGKSHPDQDLILECNEERQRLRAQADLYSYGAIAKRHGVGHGKVKKLAATLSDSEPTEQLETANG